MMRSVNPKLYAVPAVLTLVVFLARTIIPPSHTPPKNFAATRLQPRETQEQFAKPSQQSLVERAAWREMIAPPSIATTRLQPRQTQKQSAKPSQQSFVNRAAWHTECGGEKSKERHCQMERRVPGPNRKGVLMRIVITRAAGDKAAHAQVIVPPTVFLPAGVEFKPQGARPLKLTYSSCSQRSCIAPFTMDDALTGELESGSRLDVRFVMRNRKAVDIAIDLKGFAEAYEKLTNDSSLGDRHGASQGK